MKKVMALILTTIIACSSPEPKDSKSMHTGSPISNETIQSVISELKKNAPEATDRIQRGVKHAASLWRTEDGSNEEFVSFCSNNFIADSEELELVFMKVSQYMESLGGHFNKISLDLQENLHLDNGPLHSIDKMFAGYSAGAHLNDDLYKNKIAFVVALNFPFYSLEEKEKSGKNWSRKDWAYARLGDYFDSRVPADLLQAYNQANTNAAIYISEYNIHMGHLRTEEGKQLFPDDMILLSHWNLRDEIKANYVNSETGLEKQEMIFQVMHRIITQEIPQEVINNPDYEWMPYANKVFEGQNEVSTTPEPDTRYQQIIGNFNALKAIDAFHPEMDTYIKRKFSGEMEIPLEQVEALFDEYLRSPQLKKVGELIASRLGRNLRPYDIWYDGFKARSTIPEEKLSGQTRKLYPDAPALEADLTNLLLKLGWSTERANYLTSKIAVDAARGSGHAWGAGMKSEKAHLRTRIPENGMDYKGYNIAIHEFGHNVEQTISLYDVDYFTMNGVPNTAFTEALAFVFQSRDLQLLGMKDNNPEKEYLQSLDAAWSLMEIMGVGMVDMKVWKWLYAHPDADATQLKVAVNDIASEVWNTYFTPVFDTKDEPLLAIYSHMISYPLYLCAYSYGQVIEFQLEEHLKDKKFADEIDRIYQQGRLIPQQWMEEAVGNRISTQPIINAVDEALAVIK